MKLSQLLLIALTIALVAAAPGCSKKLPKQPPAQPAPTTPAAAEPTEPAAPAQPAETPTPAPAETPAQQPAPAPKPDTQTPVLAPVTPQTPPVTPAEAPQVAVWATDFDAAKAKAAADKKDLFLNFTGSDWCPYCKRLDAEVFTKEQFLQEADKRFILVTLDFPRNVTKLSPQTRERNDQLRQEYAVEGFPTVILAHADGRPYAQTGYIEGGLAKYMEHLDKLTAAGAKMRELFATAAKVADAAEKAKLLDQALDLIPAPMADKYYTAEIELVLAGDPQNILSLRNKYLIRKRYAEARAAYEKQDIEGAIKMLDSALQEFQPTGGAAQEIHFARGQLYHAIGRIDDERAALNKAVEAAPDTDMAAQIKQYVAKVLPPPVKLTRPAKIETTLKTYQSFSPDRAFDGDINKSYFWSMGDVKEDDTFTVTFDTAVPLKGVNVITGAPEFAMYQLGTGVLEVSADGTTFEKAADFKDGAAQAELKDKTVKAVRIRATKPQAQWLIIRDIIIR